MAVTLADLKQAVIVKMGETSDDGMLANLTDTINAGLQEMATERDWPWLLRSTTFTTTAGVDGYNTPTNATRISLLSIEADPLVVKQEEELLDFYNVQDRPRYYFVENTTITLAPTPNDVYTVRVKYVIAEAVLSADSDQSSVPNYYKDFAAVYCATKEAERRHDTVMVGLLEQSRQRWIKRIEDNVARTKDLPYIRTRPDTY